MGGLGARPGRWEATPTGEPSAVAGGTVSGKEQAVETFQAIQAQLQALIEWVPLGIVTVGRDERVQTWNPAAERIFGWTAPEVVGRPLPIVPEEQEAEYRALIAADLQGARLEGRELRRRRKDGTPVDVNLWTVPLRNDVGDVVGSIGVFADITRRKRGEHRLVERTRQLDAVRAVTAEIARELDLATLLQLIMRRAAELVGADTGKVWLWDATEQVLVVQAWHGPKGRHLLRLALGEGVTGRVAQRRRGLIVNEYQHWPHAVPLHRLNRTITSILAEPLVYHGRLLGVITLANGEPARPFTVHHRALLHLFADQAAIAIENARLYEAAQCEVAARTRAQETLTRYQLLADEARDIVLFVRRENGRILEANAAAAAAYGYTPAELLALHIQDLRAPDTQALTVQQMTQADTDGILFETVHRRKDGSTFPVEVSSRGTTWGGARVLLSIIRDITERKRVEHALRREEEKFAKAFRASPDGMTIATLAEGRYLEVNESFLRLVGYARDAVVGHTVAELGIWANPADRAQLVRPLETHGVVRGLEVELRRQSGEPIVVLLSAEALDVGGERCLLTVIHDITERKRIEAQMRQAQKMEALGTLAGGIVHDFNNLLQALVGCAEMATDDVPRTSPAWAHLQDVLAVASRAKDLAQQILTFSRRREQERKPVPLPGLVQESLRLVRALLPTTIEIREHVEPGVGPVLADATQIHQVLLNLCANAGHAMRERGGVLDIHLEAVEVDAAFAAAHPPLRSGPHIRLVVDDTGHGIAPDIRERIFDPFFTTKDQGEGIGMGLAVVHGIVAGHAGAITVESAPAHGTSIAVYLPQCARGESGPVAVEVLTHGAGERLLIIDDEVPVARIWGQMLESLGYQTVCCTSSVEGLDIVRAAPDRFDLVITDLVMPHLPGDQLAKELLRVRPDLPIILCSGYGRTMTDEKAKAMGIRAFLQKPFGRRELGLAVQQALRRQTDRGT